MKQLILIPLVVILINCSDTPKPRTVPATNITLSTAEFSTINTLALHTENEIQLIAVVEPDNSTDKGMVWSSDNPSVATISDSGKLRAISLGTSVITAKSASNSFISAKLTLNVVSAETQIVACKITNTMLSGFMLSFDKSVEGLSIDNVILNNNASVLGVFPTKIDGQTDSKSYNVNIENLKARTNYLISINKEGYAFSGNLSLTIIKNSDARLISFTVGGIPITPIEGGTATLYNAPHKQDITYSIPSGAYITPKPEIDGSNASNTYKITAEDGSTKIFTILIMPYDANSNPYGIYSPTHLSDVRNALTANYKLMNDINLPELDAAGADLALGISDYASSGWLPIGKNDVLSFSGCFDGNSKLVNNMVIARGTTNLIGLFGYIGKNGVIKNIGVNMGNNNVVGLDYIGGLVGYNKGNVRFAYANGAVSANSKNAYVGGLVGRNEGTIQQCFASVAVTGGHAAGGLVGFNSGNITDNFSTGAISSSDYNGGLVGQNDGTGIIKTCYSTGAVSGNYVGGLVGYGAGETKYSYWDINTSGQTTSAGGEGKSTLEMKSATPYSSFWTSDKWIFSSREYPKLYENIN
ncbi:MAG: GLUG motif-containing protein [Fusobacteriaceae bacterium]